MITKPYPRRRARGRIPSLALGAVVATLGAVLVNPLPASAAACALGTLSDFNGDRLSDAVVTDPYATVAGAT